MRWVTVTSETGILKSVSECRQHDVRCTQFSRKTVPHSRSSDGKAAVAVVCSGAWNSQSAGVSGSRRRLVTADVSSCVYLSC